MVIPVQLRHLVSRGESTRGIMAFYLCSKKCKYLLQIIKDAKQEEQVNINDLLLFVTLVFSVSGYLQHLNFMSSL